MGVFWWVFSFPFLVPVLFFQFLGARRQLIKKKGGGGGGGGGAFCFVLF
eukprot:COSAG06_NODE_64671_length_259_cov_0.518750_1_plen_48_part_10